MPIYDDLFWSRLDDLVADSAIYIDHPKGSIDSVYTHFVYPFDYGYLQETHSPDGEGIDVWLGSQPGLRVTSIIVTVDLLKRDSEIKILIGCSKDDAQAILRVHNTGMQSAVLVERS